MADTEMMKAEMQEVREHRTWFLVVGILLIVIGAIALGSALVVTLVSMMLLGWILIVSGVLEIIHGIMRRRWKGFFINLLGGVLYAAAGFVILNRPGIASITLTLLIAIILIAAGSFRLIIALTTEIQNRVTLIFNGFISVLLGLLILNSWPASGLWVIGLFIGIDIFLDGWTEVTLALTATALPA